MGTTLDYAVQFKLLGDRLARESITPWRFERSVCSSACSRSRRTWASGRATTARGQKAAVLDLFRGQGPVGDTTGNSPGTKWAAANAIAEFSDFGRRYTKRTDQVQRSFEDTGSKQRGLELVLGA
jgi:hypothetical protein